MAKNIILLTQKLAEHICCRNEYTNVAAFVKSLNCKREKGGEGGGGVAANVLAARWKFGHGIVRNYCCRVCLQRRKHVNS